MAVNAAFTSLFELFHSLDDHFDEGVVRLCPDPLASYIISVALCHLLFHPLNRYKMVDKYTRLAEYVNDELMRTLPIFTGT